MVFLFLLGKTSKRVGATILPQYCVQIHSRIEDSVDLNCFAFLVYGIEYDIVLDRHYYISSESLAAISLSINSLRQGRRSAAERRPAVRKRWPGCQVVSCAVSFLSC